MASKFGPIHLCTFCGEKCTGKLCKNCSTRSQRKEKVIEQLKIDKENAKKGYVISDIIFNLPRELLIKKLKLTKEI